MDGGLGPRTQHSADYMKAHRTHTRKHPERAPNVHMPCHSSSLKAAEGQPKENRKNNFHFRGLIFRYSERALNSLFGSGLTFARGHDGQHLHAGTPGMCRLGVTGEIGQGHCAGERPPGRTAQRSRLALAAVDYRVQRFRALRFALPFVRSLFSCVALVRLI